MTVLVQMLLTALAAVSAENIFFSGGIGFSRVLRAARKPQTIRLYSVFITFFSLVSILLSAVLNPLLQGSELLVFLRPVIFAGCAAVVYFAVSGLTRLIVPEFFKKHSIMLSSAAINTVVLSMPYVQRNFKYGLPESAAFAVGTGAAFFLAATVLTYSVASYRNDDMPKAFRGLPAVLLYLGILSLAFAGLTGGKLF
jgi:electron transport complex protein RnfA